MGEVVQRLGVAGRADPQATSQADARQQIDGAACPAAATECSGLANAVVRYGVLVARCLTRTAESETQPKRCTGTSAFAVAVE
jgi:hypothetical protein